TLPPRPLVRDQSGTCSRSCRRRRACCRSRGSTRRRTCAFRRARRAAHPEMRRGACGASPPAPPRRTCLAIWPKPASGGGVLSALARRQQQRVAHFAVDEGFGLDLRRLVDVFLHGHEMDRRPDEIRVAPALAQAVARPGEAAQALALLLILVGGDEQ